MILEAKLHGLSTERPDDFVHLSFSYHDEAKLPISFSLNWRKLTENGLLEETDDPSNDQAIDLSTDNARSLIAFLRAALKEHKRRAKQPR